MEGPPPCRKADFKKPRLRKCPFDLGTILWAKAEILGAGYDGHVWKVQFQGDEKDYVIKVFWNTGPQEWGYYAVQRECQNNAILQMIQTAVEDAKKTSHPILVRARPVAYAGAMANLLAFSDEARQSAEKPHSADDAPADPDAMVPIEDVPRFVTCYGWLDFSGQEIRKMPKSARPRCYQDSVGTVSELSEDGEYKALVYEYIPKGPNDLETVRATYQFLWRVGFCVSLVSHPGNWHQSVLIDMSDIVCLRSVGWSDAGYRLRSAARALGL
ncbi:hypothetical protein SPI_01268 [Niveomyces insectorum RCEF 264]|uniref:Protein kinase-like domain protein n=1 Tax=Niveomyces insectorum RCEF 264 TaxID=1081102 RepID=A0A162JBW3_9HYPO|nr:hypothetical protein SPI_01268 [Niveomyces insectorum RCEF 264]